MESQRVGNNWATEQKEYVKNKQTNSWNGKEMDSYLDPPESPADTLILVQWDSFQTSDF